jgi:hypothetical protein
VLYPPRLPMIERTALRLMIGMGVPIASAVVMEQLPKTGVADVPFAFQVEQQTLPPGSYSVKQSDLGRSIRIQSEKSAGTSLNCVAVKHKFGKAQGARLVFENHAGRYFLSEIWFDADGRGLILQQSPLAPKPASDATDQTVRNIRFQ